MMKNKGRLLFPLIFASLATIAVAIFLIASLPVQESPSTLSTTTGSHSQGLSLYASNCESCHGAAVNSALRGRTASQIQTAITTVPAMRGLGNLNLAEIQDIALALGQPATVLQQPSQTPVLSDGQTLYSNYCSSCHGLPSDSELREVTASEISEAISEVNQMRSLSGLSAAEIQKIASALSQVNDWPSTSSSQPSSPSGTVSQSAQSPTPAIQPSTIQPSTIVTTPQLDGSALYATYCSNCHGSMTSTTIHGKTALAIQSAINQVRAMSSLSGLNQAQIQSISSALAR